MDAVPQGGTGKDAPWSSENRRIQIMSEGLQHQHQQQHQRPPRNMRAERTTTSCGECRRRKQKCDQQQPCGNCQRRFPQPVCEYRVGNRIPGTSSFPTPNRAGGRGSARDLSGVNNPIGPAPPQSGTSVHPSVRWPRAFAGSFSGSDSDSMATGFSPGSSSWPGTELLDGSHILTVAPAILKLTLGDSRCKLDSNPSNALQQVLTYRRAFPNLILGADNDHQKDEWTPEDEIIPVYWATSAQVRLQRPIGNMEDQFGHLPVTQTPLNKKLLRIYFTILSRFKGSLTGDPDPSNPFVKHYAPFCLQDPLVVQTIMYASASYLHETGHLPRTAWMATKGRAIHMLNQRISSGQNRTVAAGSSTDGTSDPAIASVIQLTGAEWYWGETEDVQRHLRGLRDMIRLRGGFDELGMNGILAKNAICHDVSIALAHESNPLMLQPREPGEGGPGPAAMAWLAGEDYAFNDPIKDVPLRMSHFAPFVHSLPAVGALPSFTECSHALGIHPATASVLDNVRFLFRAVEAAYTTTTTTTETIDPADESSTRAGRMRAASRKVQLTAKYLCEHISSLHPTIPGHRQSSPGVSTRGNSPGSNYYVAVSADEESTTRSGSISSIGTAGPGSGGPGRSPPEPGSDSTTTPEWSSAPDASDSPTGSRPTEVVAAVAPQHHHQHHLQQQQQQEQSPDYMYQVIRATAIVYSRAIANRTPLSAACTQVDFLQIWATTWRVPMLTWNGAVGIFHWIMLAIAPASLATPHGRFVKNMLMVGTNSLGVGNWAVLMGAAKAGITLQRWLQDQDVEEEDDDDDGGQEG